MTGVGALLLGAAALGGICLLALYQWVRPKGAVWLPGAAHGATALAGLIILALVIVERTGTPGGMAALALVFLTATVASGLWLPMARALRRPAGSLSLVIHGTLALAGLVLLVASWPG